MPRKRFIPNSHCPYLVTARCLNKEWFRVPLEDVWNLFSDYLFFINHAFGIHIHCFTLMSNHFHMIVTTPQANLDSAMNYFMRETSRYISRSSGRINQVYGGPYHWSLLTKPSSYTYAYKYVYRNPVEAGLSSHVEDYRYSTLSAKLGRRHTIIPLLPDEDFFSDPEGQLDWLNTPYPSLEIKENIRKALRRNEFQFAEGKDPTPQRTGAKLI